MKPSAKFALFLIAACVVSTGTQAQKIYKCGSSYSQIPCPDGVAVDAQDPRSNTQKTEAKQASKSQAKLADAMEKERLQDETQARAADQALAKAQNKKEPTSGKPAAKKKSKEPEYFTAKPPPPAKN
ncbi:hypothetical protein [Rhodoferax sp.]|uniref:hypothetical protein n=1 Tax=Rhodoferax sp. TaxID=50421 RepID=UPI002ACD7DEB|nr:hypothetical protein [Rhodoferax sp.]MDZ7922419.1 hypothetical protein [Rhodoferax sp.]